MQLATSDKWAGRNVSADFGASETWTSELSFSANAHGVDNARRLGIDMAVLATPAEVSAQIAPELLAMGVRVIDISGAHRLRDNVERAIYYKLPPTPEDLAHDTIFALPEIARQKMRDVKLAANPGCYATCVMLALLPLARAMLCTGHLVVSAASGVTGAGRQAKEEYSFSEVADDMRAYRVLNHQHTPEILQTLRGVGLASSVGLVFTPHLLPVRRGILATSVVQLARAASAADLQELFEKNYAGHPFVRVLPDANAVSLKGVVGTNFCDIGISVSGHTAVITSALDNLLKGAAGQAVQNLNLMCGLPEATGLSSLRRSRP